MQILKNSFLFIYFLCLQNIVFATENLDTPIGVASRINIGNIRLNSPEHQEMVRKLDSFYAVQVNQKGFNGSVLIGSKGTILYERYFGFANKENNALWNKSTNSQLASTSKPFTGTAILMLAEKGLLNIDDKVMQYIPEFPYENITIRMLLCHRSGLKDYIDFAGAPADRAFLNNDDIIKLFAEKKPSLYFTPNTKFKYCNTNYSMLASIVEKVSGMSFKFFMENYVFEKIGLENTFIHDPYMPSPNQAANYKGSWTSYKDMSHDGVWGDKGVYSSVRDLYKWDQALYSGKLLKKSTLDLAYKPHCDDIPGIRNYGLGWRMFLYPNNDKIIYHNGLWHGNNTCFYRFIEENFTIIVLGNKYTKTIYKQPNALYQILTNSTLSFDDEE